MITKQPFDFAACPLSEWDGGLTTCRWCCNPLPQHRTSTHPSVFCSPTCTWEWKREHVWASARRAAAKRDRYRCRRCNERTPIPQVHHIQPVSGDRRRSCLHHQSNLLTLCDACHRLEHAQTEAA